MNRDEPEFPLKDLHRDLLIQGKELILDIDDRLYQEADPPRYESPVGAHVRHVLDHYLSFVDMRQGIIDYDRRERDPRIETDRRYAVDLADRIIARLEASFNPDWLQQQVIVCNNERVGPRPCESSVERELLFLVSHTVHHYALIALILRMKGYYPEDQFGVAPSTIRYRNRQRNSDTG